jgi:hypothetical protein
VIFVTFCEKWFFGVSKDAKTNLDVKGSFVCSSLVFRNKASSDWFWNRMRYFWSLVLFTLVSAHAETTLRSGPQRVSLLEVYTSEGCSSCPPAESWLGGLEKDGRLWKEIVPVAFHVDYWDDMGWKDRFAKQEYTSRQREYWTVWGTSSVYTPGFVLDGQEWKGWFNGSALPEPGKQSAGTLEVRIQGQTATIRFTANSGSQGVEAHVVPLAMDVSSNVLAGENRGRKLAHSFVALDIISRKLSEKDGKLTVELPFEYAAAKAVAVWVTPVGSVRPVQAVGGYLR